MNTALTFLLRFWVNRTAEAAKNEKPDRLEVIKEIKTKLHNDA